MISGFFLTNGQNSKGVNRFKELRNTPSTHIVYTDDNLILSNTVDRDALGDKICNPLVSENKKLIVHFSGTIYNRKEYIQKYDLPLKPDSSSGDADLILALYLTFGENLLTHLDGTFSFLIYDKNEEKLLLCRDHFGVEPLYYFEAPDFFVFSSTIAGILRLTGQSKNLHHPALAKILLFNYNVGFDTLVEGIKRLPPAHFLKIHGGQPLLKRYWSIDFTPVSRPEETVCQELLQHLRRAVGSCLSGTDQSGVFLSGGMDSSTMLALSAEHEPTSLDTFSYRCKAASFDESQYARQMAEFAGSHHHESEYSSNDVLLMPEVVKAMNEPFSDVGINIATYLLGREAAATGTGLILTGDGGDELFAGHPVYEADKIARYIDTIPRFLLGPLFSLFRQLPDSDQKKNLSVKLKRFSESMSYPRELLSHRWRIYYDAASLLQLAGENLTDAVNWNNLLEDILLINEKTSSFDPLARSLASDYQTVVDFYLRRNDLIRRFNIDIRYPMFDRKLVEYCASLPSSLKIKGWFDTKYIFKKTMEPVLPHSIIYRKDKLGHSIPLKNWIRDDNRVREMILDHVSGETISRRGLFKTSTIAEMTNDHLRKKSNHSHRLWTLAVMEMWLRHHFD
ncbi:asparagine synthetase B [Desulfomarina profundi]|uniref:asparagine synthase (glutamine-hydrolyzing) n=1 Tax=Desulfomarina profundi TaxID=2772557 RepID=A0A8D5JS93_9BACT|nr:asparagine synthase-related protein [Desulfomarina profundi]BCL61866.1 asparagine synthetase B [Desulfomarina profundi]